jgi:dephospho-CoA kinase
VIYEHRTYRLKNGSVPEYLRLVGDEGLAIQRRHLGQLVGYFTTEIGALNEITHIWAFASHDDRAQRRAALMADPAWRAFLPKIQILIEEGNNKILVPAPFSPLT